MDTATFDSIIRTIGTSAPRRTVLRGFLVSSLAAVASSALLQSDDASAKRRQRKKKAKKATAAATPAPPPAPLPEPEPLTEPNPCAEKNWCLDRSQTCGPANGHGKCLVEAGGGNICAETLFQVSTCADCESPKCTNCRCVLAAGGGDRCNNGANGFDFICVREV